jgi:phosphoglycolate phosphatase-like HAD superfamily hydrolase
MVGDREHDIYGAKNTNINSIGVLYGYGEIEELVSSGTLIRNATIRCEIAKKINIRLIEKK